jgi:hypothetical protein
MGLVTDCVREPCPQLDPEFQRVAASPQQGTPPFVAAAPPQAPAVPQHAPLAASPGASLEAQRKELSGRLAGWKHYVVVSESLECVARDGDAFARECVARLEGQLVTLEEQFLAQQSSIAEEAAAVYVREVFTLGNASST